MGQGSFSGNGNYKIDVDAALTSQSGLTSNIYWRIYVIKSNTTGHRAWGSNGSSGWADSSVGGSNDLWSNSNMEYNFQNGQLSGTFLIAEGNFSVQHRSDGNAEYFVNAALDFSGLGHAESGTGWRSLPRIQTATVPAAPTPLAFGTSTMTSIHYRFSGNSNGGATIREWQGLWQDATLNGPQFGFATNGSTVLGNLIPGHNYNFWSRGRNDIGWGPWSAVSSMRTIAGSRVKYNNGWKEAVPHVRYNGSWRAAQPYVNVNGVWRKAK